MNREAKIEAKIHSDPTYPIQQLHQSSPYPWEERHRWFTGCNQAEALQSVPHLFLLFHNSNKLCLRLEPRKHLLFSSKYFVRWDRINSKPEVNCLKNVPCIWLIDKASLSCGYKHPFYLLYKSTIPAFKWFCAVEGFAWAQAAKGGIVSPPVTVFAWGPKKNFSYGILQASIGHTTILQQNPTSRWLGQPVLAAAAKDKIKKTKKNEDRSHWRPWPLEEEGGDSEEEERTWKKKEAENQTWNKRSNTRWSMALTLEMWCWYH